MIYLVAYIDGSKVESLQTELAKYPEYVMDIEAHVPRVKVLKKKFKGKEYFDTVPLLFNYGFIGVPLNWAINSDILMQIRDRITCISHWVTDPARNPRKKAVTAQERPHFQNEIKEFKRLIPYAYVDEEEVKRMIKTANQESIHSNEDVNKLVIGDIINLMGYPFEGMLAVVKSINKRNKTVIVSIGLLDTEKEISVSFDNVIYSIYRGSYDEAYNRDKTVPEYKTQNYTGYENE